MREVIRRTTLKSELVVKVNDDGQVVATLQEAPRELVPKMTPIDPVASPFGYLTHAIGERPGTLVTVTAEEYEKIAAVEEPEPHATEATLAWVRDLARRDREAGEDRTARLFNEPIDGHHAMHYRAAVRDEIHAAYVTERHEPPPS